jgi:hypothetical protein
MIKIVSEIDTLISSGESIGTKETLLFIPRLLNAARGF